MLHAQAQGVLPAMQLLWCAGWWYTHVAGFASACVCVWVLHAVRARLTAQRLALAAWLILRMWECACRDWNPETDPHLPKNYSLKNFVEGKAACKADLQVRTAWRRAGCGGQGKCGVRGQGRGVRA